MQDIKMATENFVDAIKDTEVYKKFSHQISLINQQPDLKKKIDEYRLKSFEFLNAEDPEALFDKIDNFEREYEDFCSNPFVDSFLSAETAFCRMMQEINLAITDAVDFDWERVS